MIFHQLLLSPLIWILYHIVPSIHPKYSIGSGEVNHLTGFTKVAKYLDSHEKTLAAKAMAMTCITVMEAEGAKKQFQKEKGYLGKQLISCIIIILVDWLSINVVLI